MYKFLTLVTAVLMATSAQAAPASEASVDNLLTLTKAESTMDTVYGNADQMMRQTMLQMTQGQTISPAQQRNFDGFATQVVAAMRTDMSWEKMKPMYVQLYRDTFEQEEVDGLIAFYKSPAGQAYVAKMPVLMSKSMAISQSLFQSLGAKMKVAMDRFVAETKKNN
jgi:uncharacterized protein